MLPDLINNRTLVLEGSQKARASLAVQMVKNLPAIWETWVQSLGQENPLGKEMGTHSNILAWRIPWTLQSMGSQRVGNN